MRQPVILDVNPDPTALDWEQDFLPRVDAEVRGCRGPTVAECPILKGDPCPLLEEADGVLFQLNLDKPDHRHILANYTRALDVPIRVVVSKEQKEKWSHLLDLVEVFTPPVGPAMLDAFAAEAASEVD